MPKARSSTWFAVSTITALQRRKTARLLVFEDVYLVRARTEAEASRRGAALAKKATRSDEPVTYKGEPVQVVFAGVRKVVSCSAGGARGEHAHVSEIEDGTQATYSQLVIASKRDLKRLVEGESIEVVYEQ
jgi:hypothetical protein